MVSKKKQQKKNLFGWNYNKEKMLNGVKYACMTHECEREKDGKKKLNTSWELLEGGTTSSCMNRYKANFILYYKGKP